MMGQMEEKELKWLKLDNAAKIYPAARRRNWNNMFRVSATLKEPVDPFLLNQAVTDTVPRFPSISARLRKGFFWYYLEETESLPRARMDTYAPLADIRFKDIRKCAFRVLYYRRRIALEIYHSLTDGNGGLVFLKTVVSRYLELRYGIEIAHTDGVLDIGVTAPEEELEVSFLKYSGDVRMSRKEPSSYHIKGQINESGYLDLTCVTLDVNDLLKRTREKGVTITEYLTALFIMSTLEIQKREGNRKRFVKILVPVNLRKLFLSSTLRNFVLFVTPGVDPKLGEYTFDEVLQSVHYQMKLDVTPKNMRARIAANVKSEKYLIVRIMPLAIKNMIMKLVYSLVGETKATFTCSNLGNVKVPSEMEPYIERFDFVLGAQVTQHNNCGVVSFGDKLRINLTRNIKEAKLEYEFIKALKAQGIAYTLEGTRVE